MASQAATWWTQAGFAVALLLLLSQAAGAQDDAEAGAPPTPPPQLELSGVKVVVRVDASTATTLSATYPQPVLSNPQIPPQGALEVTFSVLKGGASFKPQQAMLVLRNKATGLSAYAVAKAKGATFAATITTAALEKQLGKLAGEYDVSIMAGDPTAPNAVAYALGTAELLAPGGADPALVVRTAAFQPVHNLKPEIAHSFRLPEKRPPVAISYAFAGLTFVPLVAVLLYVTAGLKANVKGLSTAPIAAIVFHGSIAAMLGLYVLFWLQLNLAQTLVIAMPIGLVTAISGFYTLSGLAGQRLKRD